MNQEPGYLISQNYQHNLPCQSLSSHAQMPHSNIAKHMNPKHQQYNQQNRFPLGCPQDNSTTLNNHDRLNNNTDNFGMNNCSFQNSRNPHQIVMANSNSQNNNPYSSMNGSNSAMKVRTISEGSPSTPRYSAFFADPKDNETMIPSASRIGQNNAAGFIEPETQMPILRANNNYSNLPEWNASSYNMRAMTATNEDRTSASPYSAPNQKRDFMGSSQRQKTTGTFDNARNLNAVKKNLAKFEFIDTENEQISSAQQLVERFLQNSAAAGASDVSQITLKDSSKKKYMNEKQRYAEGLPYVISDPSKAMHLPKGQSQPLQQQQQDEEQSFSFLFQQLNHLTNKQQSNQQKYTNPSGYSSKSPLQGQQYPYQKNQIPSSKQTQQNNSLEFKNLLVSPLKQQQHKTENTYVTQTNWDSKVTHTQPSTPPQYLMQQQQQGIYTMQPQFFHSNTSSHKKIPYSTESDLQLNPTQCLHTNIHQSTNNKKTSFDIPLDSNRTSSNNHSNTNSSSLKFPEKTNSYNHRLTQNCLTGNYVQNIQQQPQSNSIIYVHINSGANKNRSLSNSRRPPYQTNEQTNVEALQFQQKLQQQYQQSQQKKKNPINPNTHSSFGNRITGSSSSSSKSSSATIYQSTRVCSQHDGGMNPPDSSKKQLFYSSNTVSKNASTYYKGQIYKNYYQGSANSANKTICNYPNNNNNSNSNTQSSTFNLNFEQKDTSQTFNFAEDKDQSKFDQPDSSNVSCNLFNYENKDTSGFSTPIKQSNSQDRYQQSLGKRDANFRTFALATADSPKFVDPQNPQRSNHRQTTEYSKQPMQILLLGGNQNCLTQPSQIASNPIITPSHADILGDQQNIFANPHFFLGNRGSQVNELQQRGNTGNDNTLVGCDRHASPFRYQDNSLKQTNVNESERNKRNLSASPYLSAKKNDSMANNADCGHTNTEEKYNYKRFEQVKPNGNETRNIPRRLDDQEYNQGVNILKANNIINNQLNNGNDNPMKIPDNHNNIDSNNLKTLGTLTPSKMQLQGQIVPQVNYQDQEKTLEKNSHSAAKPVVPVMAAQSKRSSSTKKEPQPLEFHKSLEKFLIGKVLGKQTK